MGSVSCCASKSWKSSAMKEDAPLGSAEPSVLLRTTAMPVRTTHAFLFCGGTSAQEQRPHMA